MLSIQRRTLRFSIGALVCALAILAVAQVAKPQTAGCSTAESRIVGLLLNALQGGEPDTEHLQSILDYANSNCLAAGSNLNSYQRFSLTYAAAYGEYFLGILQHDVGYLQRAESLFTRAENLYRDDFDAAEKLSFCRLMRGWAAVRKYQAGGSVENLQTALRYLGGATDFGSCHPDAAYLRAVIEFLLAQEAHNSRQYASERNYLDSAIADLSQLPASEEVSYLLALARLQWARSALLERIEGNHTVSDHDLQAYLQQVPDGVSGCGSDLTCFRCLFQEGMDLRGVLSEARQSLTAPAGVTACSDGGLCANAPLNAIDAFLAIRSVPADGDAESSLWRDWGRFFNYYRSAVPGLGPGAGVLAGLFTGAFPPGGWRTQGLEKLRNYGQLLSRLLSCGDGGAVPSLEDLPNDPRLHARELLTLASGGGDAQAGLWALALGKASSGGCLYDVARTIFNQPGAGNPNAEVERLARLACATAKGGAFGPVAGLDALEAQLAAIADGGLDPQHRVEKYFVLGVIHQFVHGWDAQAQNYFDQVDDIDPRSAYMLHYVAHPATPDIPNLQRALWQTQQLLNSGYSLHWLQAKLEDVLNGLPPAAAPSGPVLLADDSDARWDILSPLFSENNLARRFYLDLLGGLSEYACVYAPLPELPVPWVSIIPPLSVKGPREFNLQSEIPVRVVTGPSDASPARLWVLHGEVLAHQEQNYQGTEFRVTTGLEYNLIVSVPGFWPAEIDTSFAVPHESVSVNLLRPLVSTSGGAGTAIDEDLPGLRLWAEGNEELVYNPYDHTYYVTNGKETARIVSQRLGEPFWNITKFTQLPDGRHVFLDVGNNRILVSEPSSFEAQAVRDLESDMDARLALDMSQNGGKVYFADAAGQKIVVWGGVGNTEEIGADFKPTSIAAIGETAVRIWAADVYEGAVHIRFNGRWISPAGLDRARADGLRIPGRILYFRNLNYVALTDLGSNRIYLFLPVGEYVGSLELPGKGPVYWARLESSGDGVKLTLARGSVKWSEPLNVSNAAYQFSMQGNYAQESAVPTIWGGWLTCQ